MPTTESNLRKILSEYQKKRKDSMNSDVSRSGPGRVATDSKIPDIFFDQVLIDYRLTRHEIIVLMHLYRIVWCRPNLHKLHGISPLLSLKDLGSQFSITYERLHEILINLEKYGFINIIRPGQFFVRKYFTKANDEYFRQTYDDFEI